MPVKGDIFGFIGACQFPIDPLHVRGNAANLEDRTMRFFTWEWILIPRREHLFCFVLQLGCIPKTCKGSILPLKEHWKALLTELANQTTSCRNSPRITRYFDLQRLQVQRVTVCESIQPKMSLEETVSCTCMTSPIRRKQIRLKPVMKLTLSRAYAIVSHLYFIKARISLDVTKNLLVLPDTSFENVR